MSQETKSLTSLSQNEVDNMINSFNNVDPDKINKILNNYSNCLSKMIAFTLSVVKKNGDEDEIIEIEHLKRIIALCPIEERIIRTKDKVWDSREHILNRNADYFLNRDYSNMIKNDQNQAMIETLIDAVKNNYNKLSKEEKEYYWNGTIKMLKYVIEFKKITGDYN